MLFVRCTISLVVLLAGCGAASRPAVPAVVQMEEMRIVAARGEGGELVFDGYDAGQLFERGTRRLNEGHCREAVEQFYDRIAREFPTSRYVGPALYNAGLCLHETGELEASVPYYRQVLERAPESRDAKHAALQLAQVYVGLERWDDGLALSDRLLLREDLSSTERLEGLARRAQSLLGLERLDDAERQARDALSYYRTRRGDDEIRDPYFAAAANFVLAETMRSRSEHIELPAADALTQHEVLDRRAALLLNAQREYFNTIRFTDAHWSAAAGYRIGSMYDHLWQSLMRAPIAPPSRELEPSTMPIYEEEYRAAMARHIRPLIRHAIRYWEMTLMLIERTGVETEWAERARTDLERMRGLLLEQNAIPEQTSEEPRSQLPDLRELERGPGAAEERMLAQVRAPGSRERGPRPVSRCERETRAARSAFSIEKDRGFRGGHRPEKPPFRSAARAFSERYGSSLTARHSPRT